MKPNILLLYWGTLVLLGPIPHLPKFTLADDVQTHCAGPKTASGVGDLRICQPGEFCGINRLTGQLQGCVASDQCPDDGDTAKNRTIVCSSTKPSCCCRTPLNDENSIYQCNNLLNPNHDTQWKQACSLPELNPLPVCQGPNPATRVWCSHENKFGDQIKRDTYECKPTKFCGIAKASGALIGCIDENTDCPASAKGSGEIVCEPGKPNCCCQVHVPYGQTPTTAHCNNFKEDYAIWKQACGLNDLRNLDACKVAPSTPATATEASTVTAGKTVAPGETKKGDFMDNNTTERNVVIAAIVILVIIVLLVVGGLVYFYFFRKPRPQAVMVPVATQQLQQVQTPTG